VVAYGEAEGDGVVRTTRCLAAVSGPSPTGGWRDRSFQPLAGRGSRHVLDLILNCPLLTHAYLRDTPFGLVKRGERRMADDREASFDAAMMDVYRRALQECGYNAARFLQMLYEHRGLGTARILLHAAKVSEGYIALWERKRLDLTVEALILNDDWQPLFTGAERAIAQKRLTEYGYEFTRPK
jgi:hypothetical protein